MIASSGRCCTITSAALRGIIAFEWDLVADEAFIQITQLPMHSDYEEAMERFVKLVRSWLPIERFKPLSLRDAIVEFERLARKEEGAVRSHRVELQDRDGRRVAGLSASAQQPLGGNDHIDKVLEDVSADGGTGHQGNFYLTPDDDDETNPIEPGDDVHITVLGNRDRFNIMTPQTEEVVRYAIRRVREACE